MGVIIPQETGEEVVRRWATALFATPKEEGVLIRALAYATLDEINILRAQHSLAAIAEAQFRTRIQQKITDGDADA